MSKDDIKIVARNRKARHEYFIEETIEAGIVLKGTEVKSIRNGRCNIRDGYGIIEGGEAYIYNMHISPYEQGNIQNVDPLRKRKLLLNRSEINRLIGLIMQKGYTFIPVTVYIKNGLVKIEMAVAKGKKLHDKRETMARRDAERRIQGQLKERY